MYRPIILFLSLVTVLSTLGQDTCRSSLSSASNLEYLKSGVLLVRLHTRQPSINSLRERGLEEQAIKLENEQLIENLKLVKAFRRRFTICPVYFFYNTDTDLLLNGELTEIHFLDDNLQADDQILLESHDFFIAELTYVQQDTHSANEVRSVSKEKGVQEDKYVGGAYAGFHALILKDSCLIQLRKPFPYYSRTWKSLGLLDMDDVVHNLNKKLERKLGLN